MKQSAGLLIFRKKNKEIEILLVHPGGPFWQNKDLNSWSIPKGEIDKNEDKLSAAIREFEEETGLKISEKDKKNIFYLGEVKSKNKIVYVYALEKDYGDDFEIKSNLIEINWQEKVLKIPEVDKAKYFDLKIAEEKLVSYQKEIITLLRSYLKV
jgi:predicted NUDIX family NTP pyrophosphohydrolase